MKKIVLISIFYLLAMTGFVLAIMKISGMAYNVTNIIGLALSTIGIFLCGRCSGIIAEEFKLYKVEKCIEEFENDEKNN